MTWSGGCKCGAVAFEAVGDPQQLMECNCSICRPKGYLFWFVPADEFRLTRGAEALAEYTFKTHQLKHRFCATCGVSPLVSGPTMVAVNMRCVEGFDLKSLPIKEFDGAAL
jgi:hypothetical protein